MTKTSGWPAMERFALHRDPTAVLARAGEPLGERHGLDPRSPDDGRGVDALAARQRGSVGVELDDPFARVNDDAEAGELLDRLDGQLLGEARQHVGAALDQMHLRQAGIDAPEIAGQPPA